MQSLLDELATGWAPHHILQDFNGIIMDHNVDLSSEIGCCEIMKKKLIRFLESGTVTARGRGPVALSSYLVAEGITMHSNMN